MEKSKKIKSDLVSVSCGFFEIKEEDFFSKKKPKNIVKARRFISAYLKGKGKLNDSQIGKEINRHRTTIIHNNKKHKNFIRLYLDYKEDYQDFKSFIEKNCVIQ